MGHRLGTRFDVTTSNLELADPRLGRLQFRGRVLQLRRTEREVGLGRRSRARLCEQLIVAREGEPEDPVSTGTSTSSASLSSSVPPTWSRRGSRKRASDATASEDAICFSVAMFGGAGVVAAAVGGAEPRRRPSR